MTEQVAQTDAYKPMKLSKPQTAVSRTFERILCFSVERKDLRTTKVVIWVDAELFTATLLERRCSRLVIRKHFEQIQQADQFQGLQNELGRIDQF